MPESRSFFDVDRLRPKGEAIRAPGDVDDGYPWLAFDARNFRHPAQRSNRLSTNEAAQTTEGKRSWIRLLAGSPRATWADQCGVSQRPILFDPMVPQDVDPLSIGEDGRVVPSRYCVGAQIERVARSAQLLGLTRETVLAARKRVVREVTEEFETSNDTIAAAQGYGAAADPSPVGETDTLLRHLNPGPAGVVDVVMRQAMLPG